jgi:hypothetical protein
MQNDELTPKPKKRKEKPPPASAGPANGRDGGERPDGRETRATDTVSSGNVEAKIWANPIPGGGFTYRFRLGQRYDWTDEYFDGEDDRDAIRVTRKVRKWILRHRWRTLFGSRR